jgi:ubiquinone/menaquinone biosynthesis C-methylase UbiE
VFEREDDAMGSSKTQSELWGAAADRWAEQQERTCRPLWLDVLAALDVGPGMHLLDAGCGAGAGSVDAATLGCRVTGADATAPLLEIAQRRLPGAQFDVCDLESLAYDDESFDRVMAINAVFYCDNQAAVMRELCRVARRGGLVGVTAWGPPAECEMGAIFRATASVMPPQPPGSTGPVLSDPGALEKSLSEAGLTPRASGRSQCPFEYEDVAHAWSAQSSSGPVQKAIRIAGEEAVEQAFCKAAASYVRPDGRIVFQNVFLWSIGQRS